jgi:homoserine dehydrogenase
VVRNLEEYYDNDLLQSVSGIVNGSTNYILTLMGEGRPYEEGLRQAQALGFAETDPSLDVEGRDAVHKLVILLAHAYGIIVSPAELLHLGITRLSEADARYAQEKNYRIRLTAQAVKLGCGKIAAFVLPQYVDAENLLFRTTHEFNGVVIERRLADRQFLYGKGAGRFPTASAVSSDISALTYHYRYEYRKLQRSTETALTSNFYLQVYVSFNDWADVNKWDFEQVIECHSTEERQYITGIIHAEKLAQSSWLHNSSVSVILLPQPIMEKETLLTRSLKKFSLQLAGKN